MGDPLAPSEVEENSGGGRLHPSVTPRNDQAGSLGIEEKASPPSDRIPFQGLGNSLLRFDISLGIEYAGASYSI